MCRASDCLHSRCTRPVSSPPLLCCSVYPAVYFLPPALLAACGYTAVLVNFRGSQGFGEDNVQSLPGNVGVHDVADCIAALDAAVAEGAITIQFLDPSSVVPPQ